MSNVYIGEGLLTRFEEKTTTNGNRVCSFSILLPEKPPVDGQQRKDGTFVSVESWDISPELAAHFARNVKKCRAFVKGRLKLDSWVDKKTNEKRSSLKVVADRVTYVELKQNSGGGSRPQAPRPAAANKQTFDENGKPIPF